MAPTSRRRWAHSALLFTLSFNATTWAQESVDIEIENPDGEMQNVPVDRYPSLYSGDFGDCLGGESLFNITKFDSAYYADNGTVVFHLDGSTSIREEDLLLRFTVEAYGESRFDRTFSPCDEDISSLCPLSADNPIEAWAQFDVPPSDFDGIPSIDLDIPDFEGAARMRVFANSSETEIGCFQTVMRNGNSFSHPYAISSAMGGMTALAILSSFATAIYGVSIPHMRTHYAHSFSVMVIFETFQTIYLSGALSVRWPSVLPAWWSNFAWSTGLIYSRDLVSSLNDFAGINGNASQVGGAGSTVINTEGGIVQRIYGRSLVAPSPELLRRAEGDQYDYTWAGDPVSPGLPMPGTWTGFPGTLSSSHIPVAGAFLVALVWWLVAIGLALAGVTALKFTFDLLARLKWMKQDRFEYFRAHLPGYLAASVLRTTLIAYPALITLALYQFNIQSPAGPIAIAAVVFAFLSIGLGGLVAFACYSRVRFGKFETGPDPIVFEQSRLFRKLPFITATRTSILGEKESAAKRFGSLPFFRVRFIDSDPNRVGVYKDVAFIKRFGWLSAHYRRKRWWFFILWFSYHFVRACFIGGGARNPLAQVFGLFVWEVLAFVVFVKLRPFEGQRNSVVAVWMLGIAKVITTGLSIAFLAQFAISRIVSTILGIIIIVVQGFLVLAVVVLVLLGMVSSWMSLNRNRETFRPEMLDGPRIEYYEHLQNRAPDLPPPPKAEPELKETQPQDSSFSVHHVRRTNKIEDEDEDSFGNLHGPGNGSVTQFAPTNRASRTNSMTSRYSVGSLPRRARPHRASWSSKDFAEWEAQFERPESAMGSSLRAQQTSNPSDAQNRQRSNSLRQQAHANAAMRMQLDLSDRPRTSGEVERHPLTPAIEIHEDQALPGLNHVEAADEPGRAAKDAASTVDSKPLDRADDGSEEDQNDDPVIKGGETTEENNS